MDMIITNRYKDLWLEGIASIEGMRRINILHEDCVCVVEFSAMDYEANHAATLEYMTNVVWRQTVNFHINAMGLVLPPPGSIKPYGISTEEIKLDDRVGDFNIKTVGIYIGKMLVAIQLWDYPKRCTVGDDRVGNMLTCSFNINFS
jgi:hypothetical protein